MIQANIKVIVIPTAFPDGSPGSHIAKSDVDLGHFEARWKLTVTFLRLFLIMCASSARCV